MKCTDDAHERGGEGRSGKRRGEEGKVRRGK